MSSETRTLLYWDRGTMEFDASVKESFTHDAEVTRYPIEVDCDRADHVRVQPVEIEIAAVVSNTPSREDLTHLDGAAPVYGYQVTTRAPIAPRGVRVDNVFGVPLTETKAYNAKVRLWSSPVRRVTSVYAELLRLQREARAITILTAIGDFDDMVLRSLSISRDASTANVLDFSARFTQVAVTTLTLETLKPIDPKFLRGKKRKQINGGLLNKEGQWIPEQYKDNFMSKQEQQEALRYLGGAF